jgi:S-adenosylmethionine:tRNA ribosyltransferase-isomerase
VRAKANEYGHIPIPPYVRNEPEQLEAYQTAYAKQEGSVAAPTAGFHFTPELIEQIRQKGVTFHEVTLHVGLGTFLPVKTDVVSEHQMHAEGVEVTKETADAINTAKAEGRRIIAVGTTSVRTLEGVAAIEANEKRLHAYTGDIDIFITPGFEFKVVDAMITNFHLPKSTLLMLVAAFVGDREFTLDAYKHAVDSEYRFYSFGDGMFINN